MSKYLTSIILLLTIACSNGLSFSSSQDPQRERRAVPAQQATPSPSATPTPKPVASANADQTPEASPAPVRTPLRADTTRTLSELQTRINQILRKPELEAALVGVKVVSLDTGRVLFE